MRPRIFSERREFSRQSIELPVRCSILRGEEIEALIIDMTIKGVAVLCQQARPEGEVMTLRFNLPIGRGSRLLELSAMVIHNFPARLSDRHQEQDYYVIGLHFISPNASDIALINRFLYPDND